MDPVFVLIVKEIVSGTFHCIIHVRSLKQGTVTVDHESNIVQGLLTGCHAVSFTSTILIKITNFVQKYVGLAMDRTNERATETLEKTGDMEIFCINILYFIEIE